MVDITDFRALEERVRGCEYVINLAAVTSNVEFERDPPYRCYSVNVNGFLNVLEASRRNSVRKVVYASSAAVYLDSFSENVVIDHNRQRNHYAKSKLMNEMHAASYSDIYGLRCVGLRLFNVFGPDENQKGDYASIISRFLRDHEEGGRTL
ncbi:NAD-dependent epimerase/dehydratase family protein [Thermogymnomonas acidicola]|uniref:NAD-dependent epimerase/dehydratase family protein n=1 Tax=Thermogymnomonas acidicola TaxID=399579 RepID=UPI000946426F|nr:NAD-dependent epimerase/dehydratase family protein [Thermogymnomonas acidicola]